MGLSWRGEGAVGNMLDEEQKVLVAELVKTNFKNYAEHKLGRLEPAVLSELARLCTRPNEAPPASPNEQVITVLAAKKAIAGLARAAEKARAREEATLQPVSEDASAPAPAPAPPASPAPSPPPPSPPKALFQMQHSLSLVSWNSLKLRIEKEELADAFEQLADEFAKHDVIHLSEVRAAPRYRHRIDTLLSMLNARSGDGAWSYVISEPSGPGAEEVHVLYVKAPVKVVASGTLHAIGGVQMDHAPLVATIEDRRFGGELRKLNFVGVHMPPGGDSNRRSARDEQARALLKYYALQTSLRLHQPFTTRGARDAGRKNNCVAHLVCGDFNASALELRELGADTHGWSLALGSVRTSSGGANYDNFAVNRDAADHLTVGARVLALAAHANFARGIDGVSDHSPIVLTLTEVPRRPPPPRRKG